MKPRHACPCCQFITLTETPGSHEICPVCFWEDDMIQREDPTFEGGANRESLTMAQANVRAFGASSLAVLAHVRPHLPEEEPDGAR
ncbi:CPCC family cysteine-rich protein [Chondromyces crocatus]|uniref:CPCC family cysteine-rich protein n=1 Tax=Chondromyces crocatus TaxID=52 RepID=UPI00067B5C1B|nr:CPCC family cysteine-rich protein [Chondromyces crocatus]